MVPYRICKTLFEAQRDPQPIKMVDFTIIIPSIGRPRYLVDTLGSVRAQTYRNYNVVISDNCAEPPIDPVTVGRILSGVPHRIIRRQSRMEFVTHMNTCLRDAHGEWSMILSDDDLIAPNFLEVAAGAIAAHPEMIAIVANQTKIDEEFSGFDLPRAGPIAVEDGNKFVRAWLKAERPEIMTVISLIARRAAALELGGFSSFPYGAHSDNGLLVKLSSQGKIGTFASGFHYRVYTQSSGLSMPLEALISATRQFELALKKQFTSSRDRSLLRTIRMKHTRMIVARWWKIYRGQHSSKVRHAWLLFCRLVQSFS